MVNMYDLEAEYQKGLFCIAGQVNPRDVQSFHDLILQPVPQEVEPEPLDEEDQELLQKGIAYLKG